MNVPLSHLPAARRFPLGGLLALAATVVVVAGLRAAAPLLTQILVIAFLVIVLSPLYDRMRKWGVPEKPAVALLILATVGVCLYGVGVVLPRGIADFSRKIPAYHRQLVAAAGDAEEWLRENDVNVPEGFVRDFLPRDSAAVAGLVKASAAFAGRMFKNGVLVLVVAGFLLAELPRIPRTVRTMRGMTPDRWALLVRFVDDVRHYMAIKASVSAATGLAIWGGLELLGVDSPELLGFIAFLLNFVPGIGSILAAIPGVLLALNEGTPTAMWTLLLYLVANQLLGNVLEPRVMGRGFGVSPAIVLLSVLFWGWVLGAVGMLFAVPLTLAVRGTIATMSADRDRGPAPVPATPPPSSPPPPSSAPTP